MLLWFPHWFRHTNFWDSSCICPYIYFILIDFIITKKIWQTDYSLQGKKNARKWTDFKKCEISMQNYRMCPVAVVDDFFFNQFDKYL